MNPSHDQLIVNEEYAEASVRSYFINKRRTVTYLVKVGFTDIGMYINGITVDVSKHEGKGLWVQMPRYFAKGGWRHPVEVDKGNSFFLMVERLAIKAVEDYTAEVHIPTPDELDQPFNLEDINFDDP